MYQQLVSRYVIVLSLLRTALGLANSAEYCHYFNGNVHEFHYDTVDWRHKAIGLRSIYSGRDNTRRIYRYWFRKTFSKFIYERVDDSDYDFIKNLTEESSQNFNIIGYDLTILIPAFMLSELKAAFQFAFIIFLPFILIDLMAILMALGMIMLPPISISLPVKLLIFVLVDGWTLIVGNLMKGFGI